MKVRPNNKPEWEDQSMQPSPIGGQAGNFIAPQPQEENQQHNFAAPDMEELKELFDFLRSFDEESPMMSQLEGWKIRYGKIYVSKVVDDSKYYVWRTLSRGEYKKLAATGSFDVELTAQEIIVEKCLLYPRPNDIWRFESDAGVIATLGKQIFHQTGFISQQDALSFIRII